MSAWRMIAAAVVAAGVTSAVPASSTAASTGSEPGATASKHSYSVALRLMGGPMRKVEICGSRRNVKVVPVGRRAVAVRSIRPQRRSARRSTKRSPTSAPRGVTLTVLRCDRDRWVESSERGWGKLPGRRRTALDTSTAGEYRVRITYAPGRGHRGGTSKVAYLRVGRESQIVDEAPVSFAVTNVNRSGVSCPSDGAAYTINGRLLAPRSTLRSPGSGPVTLYLHGLAFGEWSWRPVIMGASRPGNPGQITSGYDFAAQMAASGHPTVIVDRLGYDSSGKPHGRETCLGAQADIANQIVGQLRSGEYSIDRGGTPSFSRVALAGHSAGGAISQIAAYSFKQIDALVVMAYANQDSSEVARNEFGATAAVCARGGEPADEGGPGGYAYFGQTEDDFKGAMFHSASDESIKLALERRNRDPCGDSGSLLTEIVTSSRRLSEVSVPVLLAFGSHDALFPPESGESQRDNFSGSDDVTLEIVADMGHAMTLERTAPALKTMMSGWLRARGF